RRVSTLANAKQLGLIDYQATINDMRDMDFVSIAIPVTATVDILPSLLDSVSSNTLVIDMGSTKTAICESVSKHPNREQFLACHPIAGTEFSGPEAAIHNLYHGKVNMLCETQKTRPDLLKRAHAIFTNLGMHIREIDPSEHDRNIAYVSHLSHITSFMLGKTVMEKEADEQSIFDMAGSGFSSTVRLAKSSPEMWMPIFRHNKHNVIETLDEYISNMENFKSLLVNDDYTTLVEEMKNINKIRHILKPENKTNGK
ncbi:MAG: prephenate dehydrogenase, partial [Bacteroidota bacterium]|nr:prephenate dehydrogenase [Bacteroidota bacterium]